MKQAVVKPGLGSEIGPAPSEADIASFEARYRLTVPADYKHFMLRYNGGQVYPMDFFSGYPPEHPIFEEYGDPVRLDLLESWQAVAKSQTLRHFWDQTRFIRIAYVIGGFLLLDCSSETGGTVHMWWRNTDPEELEPGLPLTGVVAASFREFIESALHEASAPDSRWDRPNSFDTAVPISFEPDLAAE